MLTNSNEVLIAEYHIMEKRHKKLVLEGIELRKENDENVKYFVDNRISDHEWQNTLEQTASYLASAAVTMKIAEAKMEDVRKMIKRGLRSKKRV